MSDNTEKEGVTIDVTPEREETPEQASTETPEHKPAANAGSKAPLIIAILALVLVVGALVAAYQYTRQAADDLASISARLNESLQQQKVLETQLAAADAAVREQAERMNAQQQSVKQQEQALADARESFEQQEQLLDAERLKMQSREAELRASVADVHRRVGASGTRWMVAEAEYLMRVANQRLTLARDTDTARSALLLADQRLADTEDPGWNPVRDQIARDILALDKARLPDAAGISAKLNAMGEQVPQLRLTSATLGGIPRGPDEAEGEATARQGRTWDTLLEDLLAGFKDVVRVRRNDQPLQAMLPPEQQFFLYENLRLHLETARLGVARFDRELYRDSLNTVGKWLGNHFDPADSLTQNMQKGVTELLAIDIRPPLPDISQSLRELQARRKLNDELARSTRPLPLAEGGEQ